MIANPLPSSGCVLPIPLLSHTIFSALSPFVVQQAILPLVPPSRVMGVQGVRKVVQGVHMQYRGNTEGSNRYHLQLLPYFYNWFLVRKHVWLSGRKQQTHNLSPLGHHRFKPCCMQKFLYFFFKIPTKQKKAEY